MNKYRIHIGVHIKLIETDEYLGVVTRKNRTTVEYKTVGGVIAIVPYEDFYVVPGGNNA